MHSHDDDVQKEIEANERRARDTEDVGLDEDYITQRDEGDTFVEDAVDTLFNPDADGPDERAHEFEDNTKSNG